MKSTIPALACSLLASAAFAGERVSTVDKNYKGTQAVAETCFGDHELQIDIFGQYTVGEGPSNAGPIRDHGWGGGIGINYFFTRNIGLGVDGYWLYGKENAAADQDSDNKTFHNVTGSLIFRLPNDATCLAPYAFIGGGF